ncbi:putative per-hexamer repeat protein 5 [Saccostrea cucullata]|uniref:putative per-hexamer repeat protein 5 n=1 Tax=Saccostrea cuccullata TaxID=36930 RepID=UPI002ED507D0
MNRIFLFAILCVAIVASEKLQGVRRTVHITKRQAGGGCLYEGTVHRQGETWQVPCKYNCVCKDGTSGQYSCTEICPHYDTLPDGCYMAQDPSNSCCQKPQCNFQPSGGSGGGSGTVLTGSSGGGTGSSGGGTKHVQMGGGSSHSGSFMSGGSCHDAINNCANYGKAVCSDASYSQWVKQNCALYCNMCGGTSSSSGGGDGGFSLHFGTGTSGSGGTGAMTVSGGSGTMTGPGTMTGSCTDAINNCASYGTAVCTDQQYSAWVSKNCAKFCNKCGMTGTMTGTGGTMTGTGGTMTGTGGTMTGISGTMTGTGTGVPMTGTGTGGTMTGTGVTMTGTGGYPVPVLPGGSGVYTGTGGTGGTDGSGTGGFVVPGGSGSGVYTGTGGTGGTDGSGTGSGVYTGPGVTGGTGGTMTGGTGTMTGGTGMCADKLNNCANYGKAVCTDATYAGWVKENCPAYCGHGGAMTGTGGGMTGTGSGGTMTGTSTGCVYKGQVYQQGQTWKDGCTYRCTCADATTGKYTCTGLCVQWNLPSSCRLNPPAAGKCCQTPNCPPTVQVQYPPNFVEE